MIFGVVWWVYGLAVLVGGLVGCLAAVVLAVLAGLVWGGWDTWREYHGRGVS